MRPSHDVRHRIRNPLRAPGASFPQVSLIPFEQKPQASCIQCRCGARALMPEVDKVTVTITPKLKDKVTVTVTPKLVDK